MTKRKFSEEIQRVYGHINMLQHLRILDVDVKDALKYAEAKNSILLAINGVALNVLGGTAFSHIELIKNSPILSIIVALGIVFLLLSIIINLLSFMPVLKYHWLNQEEEYYNDKDNPLYIGDIARYQRNNYIKRIFTIFGEFSNALLCTLSALITPILSWGIYHMALKQRSKAVEKHQKQ